MPSFRGGQFEGKMPSLRGGEFEGKMPLSVRFPPCGAGNGIASPAPWVPGRHGGRVVMPWVIEDRERV